MSDKNQPMDSAVHQLQSDGDDPAAWEKFVHRYQTRIAAWSLKQGLQLADAENVAQEVLFLLTRKLCLYDPAKGAFPTWLRRVTIHTCHNYVRRQNRFTAGTGGTDQMQRLNEVRDDAPSGTEQKSADETFKIALDRARARVTEFAWAVFEKTALEKMPGPDVAAALGVSQQSVYMARHRVQKIVREELVRLGAGQA